MSDYKENTVGWWLSQLKEPLRSRALESGKSAKVLDDLCSEMWRAFWRLAKNTDSKPDKLFFLGASDFFEGLSDDIGPITLSGYKMAQECAPGVEEKQPELTNWEKLWNVFNPDDKLPRPKVDVEVAEIPAPGEFQWDDNTVIDFVTWYLKMTGLYEHRFEIENQDILDSFKRGDDPYLWRKPKETDPPAPGAKPIATVMTIEMQHEKRIEAIEARVNEVTDSIKNIIDFINTFYGTK